MVGVRFYFLNGVHVYYPAFLKSTRTFISAYRIHISDTHIGYTYPSARHKFVLRSGVTAPPIPNLGVRWQWAQILLREGTINQSAPSGLEITNEWNCTSAPLKCLHGTHRDNVSFNRWRREGSFRPRWPYTWPKVCRCSKNRRGGWEPNSDMKFSEYRIVFYFSRGIKPKFPGHLTSGLISTMTEIFLQQM